MKHSQIPELLTLAATIDTWWPEINAYIHTGITNARTEGYNRLVKQVNRIRFHCTGKQRLQPRLQACPVKIEDDI